MKLFKNRFSSTFLFISLSLLSILCLISSIYFDADKTSYLSSILMGLFIAFFQIIITVFIVEKIFERYQEKQWEKTKVLIYEMVSNEISDNLAEILYMLDFSDGGRIYCFIESCMEKNSKLSVEEIIKATDNLKSSLKLDDFVDHKKFKQKSDETDYMATCLKDIVPKLKSNILNLDRVIDFSQIKVAGDFYYQLILCRKEYYALINNLEKYSKFLSTCETTGEIIKWNLKFELYYKKNVYNSLIKTITIMKDILIEINKVKI